MERERPGRIVALEVDSEAHLHALAQSLTLRPDVHDAA
jgi:hypothetical protein